MQLILMMNVLNTFLPITLKNVQQIFNSNHLIINLLQDSIDKSTNYIKIHVPWKTLLEYAEIMKFNMPIKEVGVNYSLIANIDLKLIL